MTEQIRSIRLESFIEVDTNKMTYTATLKLSDFKNIDEYLEAIKERYEEMTDI